MRQILSFCYKNRADFIIIGTRRVVSTTYQGNDYVKSYSIKRTAGRYELCLKEALSFGNGSAMRTAECAWIAESLEETLKLAERCATVTHNHPEGIKGAQSVTACIYMAREGKTKEEIRDYVINNYYPLDFTLDKIRPTYRFNETCQGSVRRP